MIRQVGALPYRLDDGAALRILLITSRGSGRWLIPKGNAMAGRESHEAAAQEAFEEAGVEGEIVASPVGSFRYRKRRWWLWSVLAEVEVFPMRVDRLLETWPEQGQRRRQWFSHSEAENAVHDGTLKALIREFDPDLLSTPQR